MFINSVQLQRVCFKWRSFLLRTTPNRWDFSLQQPLHVSCFLLCSYHSKNPLLFELFLPRVLFLHISYTICIYTWELCLIYRFKTKDVRSLIRFVLNEIQFNQNNMMQYLQLFLIYLIKHYLRNSALFLHNIKFWVKR